MSSGDSLTAKTIEYIRRDGRTPTRRFVAWGGLVAAVMGALPPNFPLWSRLGNAALALIWLTVIVVSRLGDGSPDATP